MPAHEYQRQAVIALYREMYNAGKPIPVITIVDDPALVYDIKQVSPATFVCYRWVWSDADPWPNFEWGETGQTWFNHMWPELSRGVGADCYQFCNEWYSKETPVATLQAWNNLYMGLADVCHAMHIRCTIGDFSMGTPEKYHLSIFDGMFRKAVEYSFPVNVHCYAANNEQGAIDMSAGAEWYAMRWQDIAALYPGLKFFGGEIGNSGAGNNGHLFRPETPALMRQFAQMLKDSPYTDQYMGGCWWEIVDPAKGDFGGDDFTPILAQMKADLLAYQP